MAERAFQIVGDDLVYHYRATIPRALHILRERSKASGGDGSDAEVLADLQETWGDEWQQHVNQIGDWDTPILANFLMGDAVEACLPNGGLGFIVRTLEELWAEAKGTTDWLHGEFGHCEAAGRLMMDAVEAALREDGAETLRLVRAAMAEWRGLS